MSTSVELGPVVLKELRTLLDELLWTHLEAFREQLVRDIHVQPREESLPQARKTLQQFFEKSESVADVNLRRTACAPEGKAFVGAGLMNVTNGAPSFQPEQSEGQKEALGSGWMRPSDRAHAQLPMPMMSKWMDGNWHSYKAKEFLDEMEATNKPEEQYRGGNDKSKKKAKRASRVPPRFKRMSTWHATERPLPPSEDEDKDEEVLAVRRNSLKEVTSPVFRPRRSDPSVSVAFNDKRHSAQQTAVKPLEAEDDGTEYVRQTPSMPGALRAETPESDRPNSGPKKTRFGDEGAVVIRSSITSKDDPKKETGLEKVETEELRPKIIKHASTTRSLHSLSGTVSHLLSTTMALVKSSLRRQSGDITIVCLLVLNALWMGATNEYLSSHREDPIPLGFRIVDWTFCVVFVVELFTRMIMLGFYRFWNAPDWRWNVFDAILVTFNVVEEVVSLIVGSVEKNVVPSKLAFMRILRILRLARALRLLRVVHHVRELHTMVCSIAGAFRSFLWTLVLFMMILYVASVYFGQLVLDYARSDPDEFREQEQLDYYFGSVSRSFLTLYQSFTGGIDWDNAINPVIICISVIHGIVYSLYIAFSVLVMMNVVTAVFVDAAQKATKEDKDIELVNQVRELFIKDADDLSGSTGEEISWEEFQHQLANPRLEEYFKAIDLDLSEAKGLFDLLDSDSRGIITAQDFVLGCLRLTGPAKAIDLATLMKENSNMFRWLVQSMCIIYDELGVLAGPGRRAFNGKGG